jgi:CheY-like chemotaxis protein
MDNKRLILIVDDNLQNLHVLGNMLRKQDYKIAVVSNGEKALNFVKKIVPDVILLDIMMPGMNGFEVCHNLKNNNRTKEIH